MDSALWSLADREGFIKKIGLELNTGLGKEGREQARYGGRQKERHRSRMCLACWKKGAGEFDWNGEFG